MIKCNIIEYRYIFGLLILDVYSNFLASYDLENNDQIRSIGQEPYDVSSSQPNDNGYQSNDVLNWHKKDASDRPHSRQKRCKYF